MKNGNVQIGVIGLGVGRWHIESYREVSDAKVVALCDVDEEKLTKVSEHYGITRTYTDYKALCEDETIDAVSVCVPNALHAPIAVYALEHGRHVLCEKPLADTVAHGQEILQAARQAAKRATVKAMVAMKLRYSKEAQYIRGQVEAGKLGHVYYGFSTYLRDIAGIPGMGGWFTRKSMSGGGALIDNGVHLLDLTWYLMGCPNPVMAFGMTSTRFAPVGSSNRRRVKALGEGSFDVDDFGTGLIKCMDGSCVFLENGWSTFVKDGTCSVRVLGTQGGATLWPFAVIGEEDGKCVSGTPDVETLPEENQFAHFIRCIVEDREPGSNIQQGLTVLRMLDGLYRSDTRGDAAVL